MSLFAFIAFPREADVSCLKSRIDKSKMVRVKDLKGTELEKRYYGIPDDVIVYLGNSSDFDDLRIFEKYSYFSFEKVFENPFVYSLEGRFKMHEKEKNDEPIADILDEIEKQDGVRMSEKEYLDRSKEFGIKIQKEQSEYVVRCRNALYELVKLNTKNGEKVELFAVWNAGEEKVKVRTPQKICAVLLSELKESELLDIQKNLKIEIVNNTGDGSKPLKKGDNTGDNTGEKNTGDGSVC